MELTRDREVDFPLNSEPRPYPLIPFLGLAVLFECTLLTWMSWQPHETLRDQVAGYFFQWRSLPGWEEIAWLRVPGGILILYLLYFAALSRFQKEKTGTTILLSFGIAFRLALLPGHPILETDPYRYLWDGKMMTLGVNPFRYSPREVERAVMDDRSILEENREMAPLVRDFDTDELHLAILSHINNKAVPTIYMPTCQIAFAAASGVVQTVLPQPAGSTETDWPREAKHAIVVWKGVLALFEIGTMFLLVSLLRCLGRDPAWVVVYAWSPLVLKEFSNSGHFDPIVLFFSLLGLRLVVFPFGGSPKEGARRVAGGIAWALAIGCKLFPIFFIPLLWRRLGWKGLLSVGITLIFLFAPFLGVGDRFLTGLATYSDRWENNSSLVSFLEWGVSGLQDLLRSAQEVTPPPHRPPPPLFELAGVSFDLDAFLIAKALPFVLFLTVVGVLVWRNRRLLEGVEGTARLVRSSFWMVGALLLCSPTVFPWYLAWIVPFLCFHPSKAWLFLTCAVQVYYLRFWNSPTDYVRFSDLEFLGIASNWEIGRLVEYIPFYVLLLWEGNGLLHKNQEAPVE